MQNGLVSVVMETLAGIALVTTIITGAEIAGLPLTQLALEVSLQVTTSPFSGI